MYEGTYFVHTAVDQHRPVVGVELLAMSCFLFLVESFVSSGEGLCFPTAGRARLRGAHGMDECLLNERLAAKLAFFLLQTLACQNDEPRVDIIPLLSVWAFQMHLHLSASY